MKTFKKLGIQITRGLNKAWYVDNNGPHEMVCAGVNKGTAMDMWLKANAGTVVLFTKGKGWTRNETAAR